jgi:nifR3 family TIM-barrel protein
MNETAIELARRLSRPLKIGGKQTAGRLFLAPMAKLGNLAMRELILSYGGCGLLFSEMCSARSVRHGVGNNVHGFMWTPEELRFLVCQIFGSDPQIMAQAAGQVEANGFFGVDINFGCSTKAICRQRCGAEALKDPALAGKIVSAVRKAVCIPLFVKFRTGWKDDPEYAASLAKRFEDAGADALTFHPRTAPDRRTRPPRWEYIACVKEAVSIPVSGNGDVFSPEDCLRMLTQTGCDAVSIGRMAAAKPWIFAQWAELRDFGPEIYRQCAHRLLERLTHYYGPDTALRRFYKFSGYFSANFTYGHHLHALLSRCRSVMETQHALDCFFETHPQIASTPHISRLL